MTTKFQLEVERINGSYQARYDEIVDLSKKYGWSSDQQDELFLTLDQSRHKEILYAMARCRL